MGRRCEKGKPCGATCIERIDVCRVNLSETPHIERLRDLISAPIKKSGELKVGEDSRQAAKDILRKYAKEEPATTKMLSDLAAKNKMEMVGLKHRLKGEDSLARKIEQRKKDHGGDAKKAAQSLSDINRYTMQVPPGKYGKSVDKVLSELRAQGYQLRIKNYWGRDAGPYRGLNVAATAPDGRKIELQFHTKASLKVKGQSHGFYEEFRVSNDNAQRRRLWDQMVALADTIPMPKGALGIGRPEDLQRMEFEPI